jgi:hypothetical protein
MRADERRRLSLIVLIGPVLSDHLVVRTEGDTVTPGGAARLAARLRDATGVELESRPAGDVLRAVQSAGLTVPPLTIEATGEAREPSREALAAAARAVLMAIAYVPRHLDEMR